MGQVNIYKIDEDKKLDYILEINKKLEPIHHVDIEKEIASRKISFTFSLYLCHSNEQKDVSWNWIMQLFEQEALKTVANPRALINVEVANQTYCITFGATYFLVDKYCNKNFAFDFARRIKYDGIKTTALTSPNSRRNKTVSTYIDYNEFEFDSGESFTKLKVKALISKDFPIYSESIEIGNSLKFNIKENSLSNMADLIIHIEDVIMNCVVIYGIPVFSKITDKNRIKELDDKLIKNSTEETKLNISELDIVGAYEIFNHQEITYKLLWDKIERPIDELTQQAIETFAQSNGFDLKKELFNIQVIRYKEEQFIGKERIYDLIDYTDEEERCQLSRGIWYAYNDDYLKYLEESIDEIPVVYNKDYNFYKNEQIKFWEEKYDDEKGFDEYKGKADVKKCIRDKYYAERYFNISMLQYGFQNYDRENSIIDKHKFELMDLYKDRTVFAVKIGSSSSKLCYVVEQSINTVKTYKHNMIEEKPDIDNFAIWIILDRKKELSKITGRSEINQLDMLMLKNRIDEWKKEVRLLGYKPLIYINYVKDERDLS
jgi:hypothetical protein